jgi:hypothetical protein
MGGFLIYRNKSQMMDSSPIRKEGYLETKNWLQPRLPLQTQVSHLWPWAMGLPLLLRERVAAVQVHRNAIMRPLYDELATNVWLR